MSMRARIAGRRAVAQGVAAAMTTWPLTGMAQSRPHPQLHQKFLLMALDSYPHARCGGNQTCAPATAAERASPPISDDQARAIVSAATVSTVAEHCGLDWQRRNFIPLMSHYRQTVQMNDRQMALVGLLHGITMGAVGDTVRRTACTAETRAAIEQRLILK